ncbi:MAG: hypothetical protein R3F13_00150 [Prosthecobacter sp.]
MSTLVQIESAVAGLPPQDQWTLLTWLQDRLRGTRQPAPEAPASEALKAFRQLQAAVALTPESAEAWKAAVAEARR